jgi:hypothetical protein
MGDESNFVLAQESLFQATGVGPISTATIKQDAALCSTPKSPNICSRLNLATLRAFGSGVVGMLECGRSDSVRMLGLVLVEPVLAERSLQAKMGASHSQRCPILVSLSAPCG